MKIEQVYDVYLFIPDLFCNFDLGTVIIIVEISEHRLLSKFNLK